MRRVKSAFVDSRSLYLQPAPGSSHPLDRFAMDINRSQSMNAIRSNRDLRGKEKDSLNKAQLVSSTLTRHGKRMFDDAVHRVGHGNAQRTTGRRRCHTWQSARQRCYSGPTYIGSPLYNKRAKLMNEIRTRGQTTKYEKFNHERSRTLPQIQQTITKYGNEFRLVSATWSCDVTSKTQDSMLVRIDIDQHSDSLKNTPHRDSTFSPEVRLASEGTCSRKSDNESVGDCNTSELKIEGNLVNSEEIVKTPPVTLEAHEKESGEERNNVEGRSRATSSRRVSVSSEQKTQAATKELPNSKNRQSQKSKARAPKSVEEQSQSDDLEPTFKCWVDDVTVSSVCPEQAEDENNNSAILPNDLTNGVAKIALGKNVDNNVNIAVENGEAPPPDGANPCQEDEETTIVSLQDLQECEWTLPEFVCPSSEEKSKEFAIKEWLLKTSFSAADRSVPLL